jgi:hypothetical protein
VVLRRLPIILAAALCGTAAAAASAEQAPPAVPAVVTSAVPAPRLATVFELKLRLPQGRGLARLLLDAGVASDDAGQAAKLAAGRCDPIGACDAKVAMSRQLGSGLRVERIVLMSASGQTVIERRDGRLAPNPAAVTSTKAAALI